MIILCSGSQEVFTPSNFEYINSDSDDESPIEVDNTKDVKYVCVCVCV